MQTFRYCAKTIVSLAVFSLQLTSSLSQENIELKGVSTGQTTGIIAELTIRNHGTDTIEFQAGPFLIPATGKYQGYVIPGQIKMSIPPGSSVQEPLRGYCTDIHRAPVPEGESLVDPRNWVEQDALSPSELPDPTLEPPTYITQWHSLFDDPVNPFRPDNGYELISHPQYPVSPVTLPNSENQPDNLSCCIHPTFPGTDVFIPYKLDFDKYPESGTPLIIHVIREIERVYDSLYFAEEIDTPFGGDPKRQRDAVVQQTFWIFTSLLKGEDPYEKDDFSDKLKDQLEEGTDQKLEEAPPEVRDGFNSGVTNFWNTFELVGDRAKILKTGAIQETTPPIGTLIINCPEDYSFFDPAEALLIDWEIQYYSDSVQDADVLQSLSFDFQLTPLLNEELQPAEIIFIKNISQTGPTELPQKISSDACYSITTTTNNPSLLAPVAFNICSENITLDSLIRLVDEMKKKVAAAQAKLNENSLVKEARLIQMIRELTSTPEGISDLFDKWLNSSIDQLKEDLTQIKDVSQVIKVVEHIEKLLSILEKIDTGGERIAKYKAIREKCEKLRENYLQPGEDAQKKFEKFYEELTAMLEDFKGYVQGKIEGIVSDKIEETITKMLVSKYGPGPAGALMSAAEDLKNFIDALIKKGELDEAKVMFHLYYFEMLKRVYEHPKWRVDEKYNQASRIQWANCKEVEGKKVTLRAFVKCWEQAEGSARPGEGKFSDPKPVKFKNGNHQLEKANFQSDCDGECAFKYQLDMADLKNVAGSCSPAYIEIEASDGGNLVRIFGGTYAP